LLRHGDQILGFNCSGACHLWLIAPQTDLLALLP
jgi:hypothetical protein